MRKLAISVLLFSCLLTAPAFAQTPSSTMSSDQAREEHAYAVGVQTAIWGQPLVDNVHTLYAGFKAGAVGLNYLRKADLFGAHEVNRDVAPIAKKGPVSLELEHIPSY